MKKLGKIICIIALTALIIGVVCLAVGMITGADFSRIYSMLDARYHIGMYYEYIQEVIAAVSAQI